MTEPRRIQVTIINGAAAAVPDTVVTSRTSRYVRLESAKWLAVTNCGFTRVTREAAITPFAES